MNIRQTISDALRAIGALTEAECNRPPIGWKCTRIPGHDGPCAAVQSGSPAIGEATMRARRQNANARAVLICFDRDGREEAAAIIGEDSIEQSAGNREAIAAAAEILMRDPAARPFDGAAH